MLKSFLILLALYLPASPSRAEPLRGTWYKSPKNSALLGKSIFVHKEFIQKNAYTEGDVVWVAKGSKKIQVRIYDFLRTSDKFGMTRSLGKKINLVRGKNTIFISKTLESERTLTPKPLGIDIQSYKGRNSKWDGFILSAPHGDGDFFTGDIIALTNKLFGIPGVAAYGCRLSYRGHWFDCNRPLQRPKSLSGGVEKERVWDQASKNVYNQYQKKILEHGTPPYKFFVSFHGHDLRVKKNGKYLYRNVIEAMGVGLSVREIKLIKSYYQTQAKKYFSNAPKIVFGNLNDDLNYHTHGVKARFVYSALGARTYGTLRAGLVQKGLHLETPNSMRLTQKARVKTAKLLHDILNYIKSNGIHLKQRHSATVESLLKKRELILVNGGSFMMGSTFKGFWDSEYPAHKVNLKPFYMDKYEITNQQYAQYLNDSKSSYNLNRPIKLEELKIRNAQYIVKAGYHNYPMRNLTYLEANQFCRYYDGDLPTEAQWEYAASFDQFTATKYLFSNSENTLLPGELNFENSNETRISISEVGSFPSSSPSELFDMGGNVWEWTKDYYRSDYYSLLSSGSLSVEPQGPILSSMRSIRGGAFNSESIATRTTMRLGVHPKTSLLNLGFRCVKARTP